MKVWLKFLIGSILGAICALVFPFENKALFSFLELVTEIVIRFGRYMVIPLMFFTAVIAFNRLRDTKLLVKTGYWIAGVIVASSFLLTIVGLISILIARIPRIPITVEKIPEIASLHIDDLLKSLFPFSAFDTLNNGTFLLSAYVFAMLVGAASTSDPVLFRPITQLADSLSKLMYKITVVFTEMFSVGMIAILCSWTIQFKDIILSGVYNPLILVLLIDFVVVAGIIYPLILKYLCHDPHPYKVLYASICSLITAFFSGDSNLVLPLNIRHGKESLGIRRRINGVSQPLFSIFARGGSALVTTVSFIVIWRSYSSLNIPFLDILWITFVSFGISFLLGGFPGGGAFISLTVLCTLYSKGFETGFLLLKPAAPILCSFAAAFDVLTAMFGSYIVAVKTKLIEHHNIKHFI